MHVPVTQAILQNAPLLTEVHATNVPENLLRNPSLFPIYPPFDMKQETGKKSFPFLQFSCLLSPRCGWPWPCCSWADSSAAAEQILLLHIPVGIFDLWKKIAVPPTVGSQFTNTSSVGDTTPFSFPYSPNHQQKLQLPFLTTLASLLTLFLPPGKIRN